ncbi:MAG: DUF4974 domain-containing protein, partial [Pedobacter sp.]
MEEMNNEKFRRLINQYLEGDIDTEDKKELFNIYDALQNSEKLWDDIILGNQEQVGSKLLDRINASIKSTRKSKPFLQKISPWLKVAALIVLVSSILFTTYQLYWAQNKTVQEPMLTLAKGEHVLFAKMKIGEEVVKENLIIKKIDSDFISFSALNKNQVTAYADFNEIEIPIGSTYKFKLIDGTSLLLNTSSKLKFPTVFSKNSRTVYLNGEAYFDVAKNRLQPFSVVSKQQTTRVVGTRFNMKAFEEAPVITTLVEGKVKLWANKKYADYKGVASVYLIPGQQASLNKDSLYVKNVDTNLSLAWVNGYFEFQNDSITSIMDELRRYYDIEVIYKGNVEGINIGGRVSRSKSINEIIKVLN